VQCTLSHTHTHTHTRTHTHKHLSCHVQAWIIHHLVLWTTLSAFYHAKSPTQTHTGEPCMVSVLQRVCHWPYRTNTRTLEAQGMLKIKDRTPLLSVSGAAVEIVLERSEGGCGTWGRGIWGRGLWGRGLFAQTFILFFTILPGKSFLRLQCDVLLKLRSCICPRNVTVVSLPRRPIRLQDLVPR